MGDAILKYTDTTTPGTLSLSEELTAWVLLVGGGGAGGTIKAASYTSQVSGGGGAGEFLYRENVTMDAGVYTVTVGQGGQPQGSPDSTKGNGGNGGSSSILLGDSQFLAVLGGGGGGGQSTGSSGGSGGGGAGKNVAGGSGVVVVRLTAIAAPAPTHDLTVKKGTSDAVEGTDYSWNVDYPNELIIKAKGLTVSGTTTKDYIAISDGVEDLTIDGLNINVSAVVNATPIRFNGNSRLILKGNNNLQAGFIADCIGFSWGGEITGNGNLTAISGEYGSGISTSGDLIISASGTIIAKGSSAGIFGSECSISFTDTVGKVIAYCSDDTHGAVWLRDGTGMTAANGLTVKGSTTADAEEAAITEAATYVAADNCVKAVDSVAKSVLITGTAEFAESITAYHLRTGTTESKDKLMGRQGKALQEGGYSTTVGRTIIPLTEDDYKSISEENLVIVGGDGKKEFNLSLDYVYRYFYNGANKVEAGKGDFTNYAAFIIFDNDGTDAKNSITGYGYYRLYNGSYDESDPQKNFLFDVLFAQPK